MLDIKFLRQNPDVVKENIKKKESVFSFLDVFLFIIVYF